MKSQRNPRHLQAVLDWTRKHRPECVHHIEDLLKFEDTDRGAGMLLLVCMGFEAGRTFQVEHANWPLNEPHLYDPDVKGPEPPVSRFEELFDSLNDLPQTWIPALLALMVQEADRKNVFVKDGGMERFIESARKKAKEEKP